MRNIEFFYRSLAVAFFVFTVFGAPLAQASDRYVAVAAIVDKLSQQFLAIRTCDLENQRGDKMAVEFWNKQAEKVIGLVTEAGFKADQIKQVSERLRHIEPAVDEKAQAGDLLAYCALHPNWRRDLAVLEFITLANSVKEALIESKPEKDDAVVLVAIETAMRKWRLFFSCNIFDLENTARDSRWWMNLKENVVEELKRFKISRDARENVMGLLANRFDPEAARGTVAEFKHYCFVAHPDWQNAYEKEPMKYLKELQPSP